MSFKIFSLVVLSTLLVASGCNQRGLGFKPLPSASDGGDALDGAAAASGWTFRLSASTETLYVQASRVVYQGQQPQDPWIQVKNTEGNAIAMSLACYGCDCDQCEQPACGGGGDNTCGALLVETISPGSHWDSHWDGVTHPSTGLCGRFSCQVSAPLPQGGYIAHFCYSLSTDPKNSNLIGPQVCDDVPFTNPGPAIVEDKR